MGTVRDCGDFDRVWNERLDDRTGGADRPERTALLAAHAAGCEACRCRGSVYAALEARSRSWSLDAPPAGDAIRRWQAAALAARVSVPPRPRRRRMLVGVAWKAGLAASVAASVLIGSRGLLPFLYPIEPGPQARAGEVPPRLFEEAFTEATSMTWELARDVSAPAARISSEALGFRATRASTPFGAGVQDPVEDGTDPGRESPAPAQHAGVVLISGSARHAFRFLIGAAGDDPTEPETAGGF